MRYFRPSGVSLLVAAAALLPAAGAQTPWVNTATQGISRSQLARATDYGPADPAKALTVRLALNIQNKSALPNYVQSINHPTNALYGQSLTPDQFATAYAPSAAQVQQVVRNLESAGFTNVTVEPNNLLVSADGTVAQANAAFNTTIEQFDQFDARVIGNTSAAQVPVTLGSLVASVLGLNTIGQMKPTLVNRTQVATPTYAVSYNPQGFWKLYDSTTVPRASNASLATWPRAT